MFQILLKVKNPQLQHYKSDIVVERSTFCVVFLRLNEKDGFHLIVDFVITVLAAKQNIETFVSDCI